MKGAHAPEESAVPGAAPTPGPTRGAAGELRIHSNVKDYVVMLVDGVLAKRDLVLAPFGSARPHFFLDAQVDRLYGDALNGFIAGAPALIIPAEEDRKSYEALAEYYRWLVAQGFRRNDVLVTLGGGILQDISGFVASTLYRGVPWAFVPTTLLAQADSCIGSKTSINLGTAKNLIGTFYPPDAVYIDQAFTETLTDAYFASGVGEIIKFHLLSDEDGYARLRAFLAEPDLRRNPRLGPIISSTLDIKRSYFEADEFDTGRRNLLNYGHCFGHALESASDFAVSHGEAVIVGMGVADAVARERGLLAPERAAEYEALRASHYPRFDLGAVPTADLLAYMERDKKRTGEGLTMVLLRGVGDALKADDVTPDEVERAVRRFVDGHPLDAKPKEA